MDRNNIIGFTLIFILLIVWQQMIRPSEEELVEMERVQDSIRLAEEQKPKIVEGTDIIDTVFNSLPSDFSQLDSLQQLQVAGVYGPFANAATGKEEEHTLENDLIKVTFSNKGGRIKNVLLKEFFKMQPLEEGDEKLPLYLMGDDKDVFGYELPVMGTATNKVATDDLFFNTATQGNSITFRATVSEGQYFEQTYTLTDAYTIDYDIKFVGLDNVLNRSVETLPLKWIQHLGTLERNVSYERQQMSTTYFKPVGEYTSYTKYNKDNIQDLSDQKIEWMSHANQFFNSALISKDVPFEGGVFETDVMEEGDDDLKKQTTTLQIPFQEGDFAMQLYAGPKEYDRLVAIADEFQYTVPFGWNIFGTVNRYIIRPIFGFLSGLIGSKGIVILLLTLLVKLLLYPLTYRMLKSQAKMSALKPQIEKVKSKFKDDAQQQQMETMKMYREFGVSPLGGCLPMVLQMPIWFALYRFFPAAIEFRQESFLWAADLSSFDVFTRLPFEIPFYGAHISLFTILWAISTVAYTVYNTRNMDMAAMGGNNQAMMYMQYFMPIMFLFFFNNFASGLTVYLLFSSLFNIAQTLITKNVIIDHDKIREKLEEKRKKPKKKGGFQQRLEEAMKQQQQVQQRREKKKKQTKKKK